MIEERVEARADAIHAAGVVIATMLMVFILGGAGAWLITTRQFDDPVRLPLLVIAGLVSLIGILAVMAIAFKTVHLANQTQALGLPEGTVRAVIALSLILIFAVVTVYLFSDLTEAGSNDELAAAVKKCCEARANDSGTEGPSSSSTSGTGASTTSGTAAKDTTGTTTSTSTSTATATSGTADKAAVAKAAADKALADKTLADKTLADKTLADKALADKAAADKALAEKAPRALTPEEQQRANRAAAAQDFAKQLLIMLGTLITSLTSFYFGSKAANDSTSGKPAPSGAKLTGVDKSSIVTTEDVSVTAQGSGLESAKQVTLRGADSVEHGTTGFSASDTAVHFTVAKGTPAGTWSVVVKMKDGSEVTLKDGLKIS